MIRRYLSVRRQAPVSNVLSASFVELSPKLSSFLTPSPQVPVPQLNRCSDTLDFYSVAIISLPVITLVMSRFDITSGLRILVFSILEEVFELPTSRCQWCHWDILGLVHIRITCPGPLNPIHLM